MNPTRRPGRPAWWHRPPPLFWPFTIVLLPVVVLAAVGFFSLRHDRLLVEKEANERAQALADELSQRAWEALTAPPPPDTVQYRTLLDSRTGDLLSPTPRPPVPPPAPLDPARLTEEQRRLWLAASAALADAGELPAAVERLREFLDLAPPGDFAACAQFTLGRWLARSGQPALAARCFLTVAESFTNAVGETGLPLRPLALLSLLEIPEFPGAVPLDKAALAGRLCEEVVTAPTVLTPQLLARVAAAESSWGGAGASAKWRSQWEADEMSRALHAAMRPGFGTNRAGTNLAGRVFMPPIPRLTWLDAGAVAGNASATGEAASAGARIGLATPPGGADFVGWTPELAGTVWLAQSDGPAQRGLWIRYRPEADVRTALSRVRSAAPVPDYLGVGIEVAGRLVTPVERIEAVERGDSITRSGGGQRRVPRESLPWVTNRFAGDVLATSAVTGTTMIWPLGRGGPVESLLEVRVHLTDAVALFARQQGRTFWFGALIAVSAFAALVGLVATERGFRRQRHLAELKTDFVSSVSHELRAPIASVRLMAESLERGKIAEPARQREYFKLIGQESRRLSALIENVLDFARIEQGRKQYDFEPTDLRTLVDVTVKLMEPIAAAKGVTLQTRLPGGQGNGKQAERGERQRKQWQGIEFQTGQVPPTAPPASHSPDLSPACEALVDARAIQQALVNLLDNAIKHSPAGETVTVSLDSRFTPHASRLTLTVSDHGPGIPAAEHERIFERFHRLGSELRRETQGVGIGLSIVKHIIAAHGGQVRVESEPGKGSRFTIELPGKTNHE